MYIILLVLSFLFSSDSSAPKESKNNTVITGKKINKPESEELKLKKIHRKSGESLMDMMMRTQGYENLPEVNSFSSCSEFLAILKGRNIKVKSKNNVMVVVETNEGKTLKYEFENSRCPE